MTAPLALLPGFYGKVPAVGDFVTRRLPGSFVHDWDQWLQGALAASREQLAERWLDAYLTSPIWRFALSPGLCGESGWAGIVMPSVDRVGRYFPLTLAVALPSDVSLPLLFGREGDWFLCMERLALSSLEEENFDIDRFDQALQQLPLPNSAMRPAVQQDYPGDHSGRPAFLVNMASNVDVAPAFAGLSGSLMNCFLPAYSLWSNSAALLACAGLPPVGAYTALLNGDWARHGWHLRSLTLPSGSSEPNERSAEKLARDEIESFPPASGQWCSCGMSVVGMRRKHNEDALLDRPNVGIWAVADGMGGHQGGEVASQAIVEALSEIPENLPLAQLADRTRNALHQVNARLFGLRLQHNGEIMGSTVVVLVAKGDRYAFAWAGDSRLYRYRNGALEQLTQDHSLDRQPEDDVDGYNKLKQSNIITRAVGADAQLCLDEGQGDACDGDIFLLCSDGLDKEVTPKEIADILALRDIEISTRQLVDLALQRGARDNVTVLVTRFVKSPG